MKKDRQRSIAGPFDELIAVIPRGGNLLLLFDRPEVIETIFPLVVESLSAAKGLHLVSRRPLGTAARSRTTLVHPPDIRRAGPSLQRLRKEIRGCRTGSTVLIDLTGFWGGSAKLLTDLVRGVSRDLAKRSARSVWLIPPSAAGDEIALLAPTADFMAQVDVANGSTLIRFHLFRTKQLMGSANYRPHSIQEEGGRLFLRAEGEAEQDQGDLRSTFFEDLFRRSGQGLLLLNAHGPFRIVNDEGARLLGTSPDRIERLSLREVLLPESIMPGLRFLAHLRGEKPAEAILGIRGKRRRTILHVSGRPAGRGLSVLSLRDVTDDQKESVASRDGFRLFQSLFRNSSHPQAFFTERKLHSQNDAFARLITELGDDGRSRSLSRLLGKENRGIGREITALRDGEEKSWKIRLPGADAKARAFTLVACRLSVDTASGFLCSLTETTKEEEARTSLQRHADELQSVLHQYPLPLAALKGKSVVFANDALARLLQRPDRSALREVPLETFVAAKGRSRLIREISSLSGAKDSGSGTCFLLRSDGTQIETALSFQTGRLAGDPVVFISFTDRSEERAASEAAAQAIAEKEFLLDIDSGFSASVEITTMLEEGLQILKRWLHCEMGGIFLSSGEDLTMASSSGLPERIRLMMTSPDQHGGLVGLVRKTADPLLLRIAEYPAHLPYRSLFESEGIAQAFILPLIAGDDVLGIVLLASSRQVNPSVGTESALRTAGVRAGGLVTNAMRYKAVVTLEERFRTMLESLPGAVYKMNSQGSVTYASPGIAELTGHDHTGFSRNPELMRQLVHPDDRTLYGKKLVGPEEGKKRLTLEYRLLPKGTAAYRWVRDSGSYRFDSEGRIESMICAATDITEEKTRLDRLTDARDLSHNLLSSIREGVAVYDPHLRCVEWNRAMEKITGLPREKVIGLPIGETTLHIVSQELVGMLQSALSGKPVSSDDIILNRGKAGTSEEFYWVHCVPLTGDDQPITGVVLTFTNVSERRALEQSVRESEETLRNVIDGMGDALMISDLQGKVWEVNKEFTRITGYSRREVLGMAFPYPWLIDEEMARFVSWIAALREHSYLRDFDMTWQSKKGVDMAISINTSLLRNSAGEPVAMLNIARDISERKQLMTELERRNRELETLNAVSTSISKSLRLDDVLAEAAEQIRELMGCRIVLIYLRDMRKERLFLGGYAGLTEKEVDAVRELDPAESATGAVVRLGRPMMIGSGIVDDERISKRGREFLRALSLESLGVLPLSSKETVLGALDVGFDDQHEFGEQERQFLTLIGNQLGSAIENAQLYGEVRRQVVRLTSLYEVARGLTGSLDLRSILSTVYDEVRRAVPGDRFTYYEYQAQSDTLVPVFDRVFGEGNEGDLSVPSIPVDDGPLRSAVRDGGAVFDHGDGQSPARIAAPVRSGGAIAGLIVVSARESDLEEEAHLRLLESIANLTEIALEKASLYADIVSKSREIEYRNKELDDFTYVVSHDLKEPLISIEGYSKILLKEYKGEIGEEGTLYLSSLVNSSTRLKSLIDDLLTLSRLGRVTESVARVNLRTIVQEVLQDLRFTLLETNTTVTVRSELPEVMYNPTQLGIVVRNLITNAFKFNDKQDRRVEIRCVTEGGFHHVSVEDNGIGIEEAYFEKIFMIFQRLHRTEQYRGTGAGLTIVRKIVENHGGTIAVRSRPDEGSCFTFTIPTEQSQ